MSSLKEMDGDEVIDIQTPKEADNSRGLRAKLLTSSDSIAFSAKLGVFVIDDQTAIYTVRLYPTESCTCPIKRNCIHILGVKIGKRKTLNEEDLAIQNDTTVVRKNTHPTKQKLGKNVPDQVIYLHFRRKKQRLTLTKL